MRLRAFKLNLNWFRPRNYEDDITVADVIRGWDLEDERAAFINHFHYTSFDCLACIRILDRLIQSVFEYNEDDEL